MKGVCMKGKVGGITHPRPPCPNPPIRCAAETVSISDTSCVRWVLYRVSYRVLYSVSYSVSHRVLHRVSYSVVYRAEGPHTHNLYASHLANTRVRVYTVCVHGCMAHCVYTQPLGPRVVT